MAMLVMASDALPVFESFTAWAALVDPTFVLAKVKEVGERLATAEDAATPLPVKGMVCLLGLALSVMVTVPVRVPVAVGLKSTLIEQLAPAATELVQVPRPARAKSPLMLKLLLLSVKVAVPVLVSFTI